MPATEPSRIVKRSLRIAGHATSISLEDQFWELLQHVAATKGLRVAQLIQRIDDERSGANLSSAIRVYLLEWLMREGGMMIREVPREG
ncbi:MAG: ribbon-helix-helix domain-containing protein [Proteobacteria bacterium]|nr:ribbon-helix-helix domain-containing protein [Pseudomonadota bacterium]